MLEAIRVFAFLVGMVAGFMWMPNRVARLLADAKPRIAIFTKDVLIADHPPTTKAGLVSVKPLDGLIGGGFCDSAQFVEGTAGTNYADRVTIPTVLQWDDLPQVDECGIGENYSPICGGVARIAQVQLNGHAVNHLNGMNTDIRTLGKDRVLMGDSEALSGKPKSLPHGFKLAVHHLSLSVIYHGLHNNGPKDQEVDKVSGKEVYSSGVLANPGDGNQNKPEQEERQREQYDYEDRVGVAVLGAMALLGWALISWVLLHKPNPRKLR